MSNLTKEEKELCDWISNLSSENYIIRKDRPYIKWKKFADKVRELENINDEDPISKCENISLDFKENVVPIQKNRYNYYPVDELQKGIKS